MKSSRRTSIWSFKIGPIKRKQAEPIKEHLTSDITTMTLKRQ